MRKLVAGLLALLMCGVGFANGQHFVKPPGGDAASDVAPDPRRSFAPADPVDIPQPPDDYHQLPSDEHTGSHAEDFDEIEPKHGRVWFRGDYLLWFIQDPDLPPLVTTGPTTDASPGALDNPFTVLRFGAANTETHERHGGRFAIGYWFDPYHRCGVEVDGFFVGNRSIDFRQGVTAGNNVIARPFLNATSNQQDSSLVAFPGLVTGSVAIRAESSLHGIESNVVFTPWRSVDNHYFGLELLGGFRYVNLEESLVITENSQVVAPDILFSGNTIGVVDDFNMDNSFYGFQVGTRAMFRIRRLEVALIGKVAIGDSHQQATIRGATGVDTQPATINAGGLLAVASNSGRFTRDEFAVVPEAGAQVSFQICQNIKIYAGYTFIYWSSVLRPGDQVDLTVNPAMVPTSTTFLAGGPARPLFPGKSTDFWVQGANFGLKIVY